MMKKDARAKRTKNVQAADIVNMSWNDLRAFAKSLDIPAKGTRLKLEAKINKKLMGTQVASKSETGKRSPPKTSNVPALEIASAERQAKPVLKTGRGLEEDTDDGFKTGQRVQVKNTLLRGNVVDGTPRIQVRLDSGNTRQYSKEKLEKLEPIL